MAEQGFQERTERATPRRREKAREEGKVAKSPEVNAAALLSLGFLSLFMLGPQMAERIQMMMRDTMTHASAIARADASMVTIFSDYAFTFFGIVGPTFVVLTVIAVAANVAQVGFRITPKSIEPNFTKVSPISGFKRLFGLTALVSLFRDSFKLLVVGIVAYKAIESEFDSFFMLPDMSVMDIAMTMGKTAVILGLKVGAIMIVIAILDYLYKRYDFEKSIKMSKQDLKEENRDTEGSPELRGRIRQAQREMSRQRQMDAVPLADVVVTNPTHLAVALKYDSGDMNAPRVIAKGERLLAQKIKAIAREHDIPVVEDPPLARALFKICRVGDFVPENLYRAVAELLAYVYRLKNKVKPNG